MTVLLYLLILLLSLAIIFLLGPRVPIDQTLHPLDLPDDLDQYLQGKEALVSNLRPGTEKTIIWADPKAKTKTPISVVYLHGYSATRKETYPLSDEVAKALQANLFYTRLSGHGQDGTALAQATVNDWLNDTIEAFEIGRRLGDRVVIIGTSTGATLATWLVAQPFSYEVMAFILISPNFGVRDKMSSLLLWPWAKYFIPRVGGATRAWVSPSTIERECWTTEYPTIALLPLMGLVNLVRKLNLQHIVQPLFMIVSPADTVINAERAQALFPKFGTAIKNLLLINETTSVDKHVLVGDIRAPEATPIIKQAILEFLDTVPR